MLNFPLDTMEISFSKSIMKIKLQLTFSLFFRFIKVNLLLLLLSNLAYAQNSTRSKAKFNENWKFAQINFSEYEAILDESIAWQDVRLPHDWSIKGEFDQNNPSGAGGGFLPCGTAWYKKTFYLEPDTKDEKYFIRFDGVYMNSEVWINQWSLPRTISIWLQYISI